MTPSLGEGCNCALESASKLVGALLPLTAAEQVPSCKDMTQAFLKYGQERPPQVRPLQERSAAGSRFAKTTTKTPDPQAKTAEPTSKETTFVHPVGGGRSAGA